MSEEINNREYRQKIIKELIGQLHQGKSVDEVKQRFAEAFEGVSAEEISQAEQALIADGLPVTEVQRLCDVHAAVFKGSIENIHRPADPAQIVGHPAHTLKRENRALEKQIEAVTAALEQSDVQGLKQSIDKLWEIDRHYLKKENLLFPYLEQYGITAPPKVMWGVDDEVRAALKEIKGDLAGGELSGSKEKINEVLHKIGEMIFKEENILLPMLIENLTADEWKRIAEESGELGYCLIDEVPEWKPAVQEEKGCQLPSACKRAHRGKDRGGSAQRRKGPRGFLDQNGGKVRLYPVLCRPGPQWRIPGSAGSDPERRPHTGTDGGKETGFGIKHLYIEG